MVRSSKPVFAALSSLNDNLSLSRRAWELTIVGRVSGDVRYGYPYAAQGAHCALALSVRIDRNRNFATFRLLRLFRI
jgi:hypothetical protein